jgi:mRNA interferase MazF
MTSSKAALKAGDIVWVVLDPVIGTEQGGRRPAIILTDHEFNSREPRSMVCPVTRNLTPWPTKVQLPDGMKTRGAILVDQIRNVQREGRSFRFIEHAPEEVLAEVRAIVAALIGIGA